MGQVTSKHRDDASVSLWATNICEYWWPSTGSIDAVAGLRLANLSTDLPMEIKLQTVKCLAWKTTLNQYITNFDCTTWRSSSCVTLSQFLYFTPLTDAYGLLLWAHLAAWGKQPLIRERQRISPTTLQWTIGKGSHSNNRHKSYSELPTLPTFISAPLAMACLFKKVEERVVTMAIWLTLALVAQPH